MSTSPNATLPLPAMRPAPSRRARYRAHRAARRRLPTSRASLIVLHLLFIATGLVGSADLYLWSGTRWSWLGFFGGWHP